LKNSLKTNGLLLVIPDIQIKYIISVDISEDMF